MLNGIKHSGLMLAATMMGTVAFAPAQAAPVLSAAADYYESGVFVGGDSDSTTPSAAAYFSGDDGGASGYASSSGTINVRAYTGDGGGVAATFFAFPLPSGDVSAQGTATWEDTITNNHGTQVAYKWVFYIANPRLGTEGQAGDYAGLSIDIKLNGGSIWSAFAEMDGCALTHSNMGNAFVNGCDANWSSFTASVDLGTFVHGQSFTLSYEMSAFARSDGGRDAHAGIGDPFSPYGDPGELVATAVAVPAPGGLGLLALGLTGLGLIRRGRKT